MSIIDGQVIEEGQRAISVTEVSGDFIYDGGSTDVQCVVKSGDKAQRAIKVAPVGDGTSYLKDVVFNKKNIPTASADKVGMVFLFSGTSDSNYKHGYIYEGVSTPANTETVTFADSSVACSGSDFWDFWKSEDGAPDHYTEIVRGEFVFVGGDTWNLIGYNNNSELVDSWQQYQADWESAGFTFIGTFEEGDKIKYECAINDTSSAIYWWKRIDVQP